jgi:hypothetical protein
MTELPTRPADGEFTTFQEWVNKATSWIGGTNPLCADAKNRICTRGADMQRAHDEGAFPVRFWFGAGPIKTQKEMRKSQAAARKALKLQYPWRYS